MAASQDSFPPLDNDGKRLARRITALLRHGKPKRLPIRPDGFISLQEVKSVRGFEAIDLNLARAIVSEDNKMRFTLRQEGEEWFIRANQGHTIQGIDEEQLCTKIINPQEIPIAVHGTYVISWCLIKENGLSKMDRHHIHLAIGLPGDKQSGVISGMRKSSELLIYINVEKAMELGITFFKSTNDVILTSGLSGSIPPSCFKQVIMAKSGQVIFGEGIDDKADEEVMRLSLLEQEKLKNREGKGGKGGKGNRNNHGKGGSGGGGGGGSPDNRPVFIPGKGKGKGGPMRGGPNEQQSKWPEFVGQSGEATASTLQEKYPELKVVVVKVGSMVTMDHNLKRIRVYVNDDGDVAKAPKLG